MADLKFSCRCGQTCGVIANAGPDYGNHGRCFCPSCRAADIYCGDGDPKDDGITVYQTSPDKITLTSGADTLKVFSFGPKNLLRWQAGCCGALMFNTLRRPGFAFAGLRMSRATNPDVIGPVRTTGFIIGKNGKYRHDGLRRMIAGTLSRAVAARLSGRWKQTPFFDFETGQPTRAVNVLPKETRETLIADT